MTNGNELSKVSQAPPIRDDENFANTMKTLQRKRLHRKAYGDPSMHRELVRIESSPIYNANAELIQAVTTSHGSA
ncbi:hypothetical protein [Maridesulfovibrio sp.]|uniref:hypothetical protein n=1 Tax=Maridesulfovibrio sp. TaxID=2795000 RepID=UPI002A187FB8|nr:hypothetical protein [Maridesulfovibrio sp.]